MRKVLIGITFLFLTSVMNPLTVLGDEDHLIRNCLEQFFTALKSGNVTAIESAIGGDILKESKVLLRDNKEYGNFLRKYYHGAEFHIDKILQVPGGAVVDVSVIFSKDDIQQFQYFLSKEQKNEKSEFKWTIVRQKDLLFSNKP